MKYFFCDGSVVELRNVNTVYVYFSLKCSGFRTLDDLAGSIVIGWRNDDSLYHDTFISDKI